MAGLQTAPIDGDWGRAVFWPVGARWRGVVWLFVVFGAYAGAIQLYPWFGEVSVLWLPNAVLVTALLRFRPRDWPYVYLAGMLAEVIGDLTFDMGPDQSLPLGVVNSIEATLFVIVAALIAGGRRRIGLLSARGAISVIIASVATPVLTGALGGAIVEASWTFGPDYFTAWRTWWFGDSLGLLVGVPIGLVLRDGSQSVAVRRPIRIVLGSGIAAAILSVLSAFLAGNNQTWGQQQTALAAGVLLSLAFGACGAPIAALLATTVTLVALAQEGNLGSVPQEQALLFVSFAAFYAIAAMTETSDRNEQQLRLQRDDLVKAQHELERLAHFDSLTGLANRSETFARLESALTCNRTPGTEFGVLFCDVDKFKTINDTWGHAVGDNVLWTIADRIRQCLRQGDTVGRTGGDEILVLLPGVHSLDEATQIAEKIRASAAEPIRDDGTNIRATLSIRATLAIPGESVLETTARADAAMYQAKGHGGNNVRSSEPDRVAPARAGLMDQAPGVWC